MIVMDKVQSFLLHDETGVISNSGLSKSSYMYLYLVAKH